MGLESNPESKKLLEIGVKTIEDQIDCLNCDKKMKEHSKNGLIRCFYVVQSHAVKWGSELRERYTADQHQMAEMDEKQMRDIKIDQAQRTDTVVGQINGEEVRMMDNETEIADDDPHKIKFLKDNPAWKTYESPLTEEQKKMADEMPSDDGLVGVNMTQSIKDGKATGNKPPPKKKKKKEEKK
jgi:hypothetical protein